MTFLGRTHPPVSSSYRWDGTKISGSLKPPATEKNFTALGFYTATDQTGSTPRIVGQAELSMEESALQSVTLRTILSTTNTSASASVFLYNVTSGSFVDIDGLGLPVMSTTSSTPVVVESVDLMSTNNFTLTGSAIYELRLATTTGSNTALLGSSMFVTSQIPGRYLNAPPQWFGSYLKQYIDTGYAFNHGDLGVQYPLVDLRNVSKWGSPAFGQATLANRPAFSKPPGSAPGAPDFNGTSSVLSRSNGGTYRLTGAGTIGVRFKLDATGSVAYRICEIQMAPGTWLSWLLVDAGVAYNKLEVCFGNTGANGNIGHAFTWDTSEHRHVTRYNGVDPVNPSSYNMLFDGAAQGAVWQTGGVSIPADGTDFISPATSNQWWDGKIRTIVIYDSDIGATNAATLDALLAAGSVNLAAYQALGNLTMYAFEHPDPIGGKMDGDFLDISNYIYVEGDVVIAPDVTVTPFFYHSASDGKPAIENISGRYLRSGDNITSSVTTALNGANKAVFFGWFNPTLAASGRLWNKLDGIDNSYSVTLLNTGMLRFIASTSSTDNGNYESSPAGAVVANKWQFIATQYDAGVANFWVLNETALTASQYSVALGNATRTGTPATSLRTSAMPALFGTSGTLGYRGQYDQIGTMVGRTITTAEVLKLALRDPRHT